MAAEANNKVHVQGVAWQCHACKSTLGYTDNDKRILRMKYKDWFCYVEGGDVTVPCRKCGAMNHASFHKDEPEKK